MKRKRADCSGSDQLDCNDASKGTQEALMDSVCFTFSKDVTDDEDYDSLFDSGDDASLSCLIVADTDDAVSVRSPARRSAPMIPGLFFDPSVLIPINIADRLWKECMDAFFSDGDVNQVMLFERARAWKSGVCAESSINDISPSNGVQSRGLPTFLLDLLGDLKTLLEAVVPLDVHSLLFPPDAECHQARQAILNHYKPGEGITPHVDLLNRYGDGIIGVSLHSGTVMDFMKASEDSDDAEGFVNGTSEAAKESLSSNGLRSTTDATEDINLEDHRPEALPVSCSAYLPERSIFVLSGEARYRWTHGIFYCAEDLVEEEDGSSTRILARGERLSITFRWLLPGADIVGG